MFAQKFLSEVDSFGAIANASTLFADGFGFGSDNEIGLSTKQFHAWAPVKIEGLTSLKHVVLGHGEVSG